jgi:hypothetical protein
MQLWCLNPIWVTPWDNLPGLDEAKVQERNSKDNADGMTPRILLPLPSSYYALDRVSQRSAKAVSSNSSDGVYQCDRLVGAISVLNSTFRYKTTGHCI